MHRKTTYRIVAAIAALLITSAAGWAQQAQPAPRAPIQRYMVVAFGQDDFMVTEDGGARWRMVSRFEAAQQPAPVQRLMRVVRGQADVLAAAVAPNPTHGPAVLRFNTQTPGATTITVADTRGNDILTYHAETPAAGTQTQAVDLSSLPNGIYYYRIANGEGPVSSGVITVAR